MAIVSHELKSPLAAVQTTATTLQAGVFGKLEPEQQDIVETIIRNCSYLEDIIRAYIDLSKMELDGLALFKEKALFASAVVGPVLDMPGVRDNVRRMAVVTELDGDPVIEGDPNLLGILVANLVNNAVKYGAEGTPVRVRLAMKGGELVLAVRNEGVGILKKTCWRLFKRFERLKQKGTEGVKGSGLGPLHLEDRGRQAQGPGHLGRGRARDMGRVLRRPAGGRACGLTLCLRPAVTTAPY
ncbi:MAG: HAMP domain-containing histidine kinase [Candidatus Moduliflexus flocculans]|nr:HAMP domain-containing histidine kinase [Candidatus Moduliflexus flocculans]